MLLTVTTNYDGGVLSTTQSTHLCLMLSLILRGSWAAFITKHNAGHGHMVHKENDGPASKCLIKMQQNMHELVQLIKAAMVDQTPMPRLSKQMLKACALQPMYIIVQLLPGYHSIQ